MALSVTRDVLMVGMVRDIAQSAFTLSVAFDLLCEAHAK
ncbi:hypothetical protein Z947_2351 [Sulfitobacter geojensis]|nr:hypothetical protein Z947_2351 [Sulfitobacter geojensis]